jgi:hypothetical protein
MQEDMSEAWVEVSETFDLDEAMRQLVAKKVVDQEHAEPDLKHLIDLKKSIVHVAVRQKRAADVTPLGARPVTEEHWDDVKMFLWEMCNIDKMTPEVKYVL